MSYFYWDPNPEFLPWAIPILNRPILWYGVFFALGFSFSYLAFFRLLKAHPNQKIQKEARSIVDLLSMYLTLGTLIGARVFDIIFYENWKIFLKDPLFLLRIWEGGLSSHGAIVGILLALGLFYFRNRPLSGLYLLDFTALSSTLAATCIRIGNFFNQEILGKPTSAPWGVIFGHPIDHSPPLPRHPVQLYEACCYFLIFLGFWFYKDRFLKWKEGRICGLFLVILFLSRFILEFFKEEQSYWLTNSFLTMGQWLSIPFMVLGFFLLMGNKIQHIFLMKRN